MAKGEAALRDKIHARAGHLFVEARDCADCTKAARQMLGSGSHRPPRAARNGERVLHLRADELNLSDHHGRIVFTLGHRGYLRFVEPWDDGISVATTVGIATYPPDTPFSVWGP
jgi:hypothetical protein